MLYLVSLGKGFPSRPISAFPIIGLGLPSRSYKVICDGLLSVLDLEACEGNLSVNQGWLPPVLGLGKVSKRPKAPYAYCYLLAAHRTMQH